MFDKITLVFVLCSACKAIVLNVSVSHYTDVDWSSVLTGYMTCEKVNQDNMTVSMVTSASKASARGHTQCMRPSGKNPYEMIPVYSKSVDVHFKSKYCSKFIDAHVFYVDGPSIYNTLTYWSVVVDLNCYRQKLALEPTVFYYDLFLGKLLDEHLGCAVNFHPPYGYNVSVGSDQTSCKLNIKKLCATIASLSSIMPHILCTICSWSQRLDLCLNQHYVRRSQLQTYVMLKDPDRYTVNKTCIDTAWMPELTRIFNVPVCFDPIQSVNGLIVDFWIKLMLKDIIDVPSDAKIIAKLENIFELDGKTLVIRIVEKDNKPAADDDFDDAENKNEVVKISGQTLRCRQMYLAILSIGYMDLVMIKKSIANIKTTIRSSNAFRINSKVTAHFTLREPTCFRGLRSAALDANEEDDEDEYELVKSLIALAIGFSIPFIVVGFGACFVKETI